LLLEEEKTPYRKVVFCHSLKRRPEKKERQKERKRIKKKKTNEKYL
jgi:hypothetical protein